jgi:hypothetical protein
MYETSNVRAARPRLGLEDDLDADEIVRELDEARDSLRSVQRDLPRARDAGNAEYVETLEYLERHWQRDVARLERQAEGDAVEELWEYENGAMSYGVSDPGRRAEVRCRMRALAHRYGFMLLT